MSEPFDFKSWWDEVKLDDPRTEFYEHDEQGSFQAVTLAAGGSKDGRIPQHEALIQVFFQALYALKRGDHEQTEWTEGAVAASGGMCLINLNGDDVPEDQIEPDENNVAAGMIQIAGAGLPTSPDELVLLADELRQRAPGAVWQTQVDQDGDLQVVGVYLAETPLAELIDTGMKNLEP